MDAKQEHFSTPSALDEKVNLHIELEYLPLADNEGRNRIIIQDCVRQ